MGIRKVRWSVLVCALLAAASCGRRARQPTVFGTDPRCVSLEYLDAQSGGAGAYKDLSFRWEGQRLAAVSDRDFVYFDDGTRLRRSGDSRFDLEHVDGSLRPWGIFAETAEEVRTKYRVDPSGHVSQLHLGGAEPVRYQYDYDSKGRMLEVAVFCHEGVKTPNRIAWQRGPGGRVDTVELDMGSGLVDTRYVHHYMSDRLTRVDVERRGSGVAATPRMVLECTPWLGAGPGLFESPADASVTEFRLRERFERRYDAAGRVIFSSWSPVPVRYRFARETTHRYEPEKNTVELKTVTVHYDKDGKIEESERPRIHRVVNPCPAPR